MIQVCIAGATGWAGAELAKGIAGTTDVVLVSAVARRGAGAVLADLVDDARLSITVSASVAEALETPCDVLVEYTHPSSGKANILAALERGVHVVVGTSGLTDEDFAEIDSVARQRQRRVLACGNCALTVGLLQRFAEIAARFIPQWEIIDYAHNDKPDAPSGTARELAAIVGKVRKPERSVPVEDTVGLPEARGATVASTQVHSIRLPGYVISAEIVFGMPDQRLSIRHDSGNSALPYVDGALLAIRNVSKLIGVHRGLAAVMDLPSTQRPGRAP
jgi:4-hydroxy-tetrahydrodipicolinate reductase